MCIDALRVSIEDENIHKSLIYKDTFFYTPEVLQWYDFRVP